MRLTKIKLSGFKSFVDPTTFIVPNNLVGIVGPNGCGKSNIIDAITWVMGESSAKHLRGDSLTDVIFNGSGTRQPVGQTSVELEFDNSEGKLGGQYASYTEISIRRLMNREGISTYYLNGTRCRRRDIQAIFLGTGLGPRSYAIIEQGVISRLIEAKPDELRTFIEEAAGISKYRERRRETENRIGHTRENIDRLNDIREELNKQLNTLHRQSRAAERYQTLKQEERQTKAELMAMNWKELYEQAKIKNEKVIKEGTNVEQGIAEMRHIEARIEEHRNTLTEANEKLNDTQSSYYQVGSEIAQLEQKIQHGKERQSSLNEDLKKLQESVESITKHQESDKQQLSILAREATSLEPKLRGSRSQSNEAYDTLNKAENAMQGWQTEWDAYNEALANFSRQIEVDTTRLEHLEESISEMQERKILLEQELKETETSGLVVELERLVTNIQAEEGVVNRKRTEIEEKQAQIQAYRHQIHSINEELAGTRAEYQKLEGKVASLEALQSHSAGSNQEAVIEWLSSINLDKATRLLQQLEVEAEWTQALETVLGHYLQAVVVEKVDDVLDNLENLENGDVTIISSGSMKPDGDFVPRYENLLGKVSSQLKLDSLLSRVYVADDVQHALTIVGELTGGETVITRNGVWFGDGWIRVNKGNDQAQGVLSREQQIGEFREQIEKIVEQIKTLENKLSSVNELLNKTEEDYQAFQKSQHPQLENLAQLHSREAALKTRIEQADKRIKQLNLELEDIDAQHELDVQETETIRQRLKRTEEERDNLSSQRNTLSTLREQHRGALDTARSRWQSTHEQSHEIALQLESISSQRASLEQAIQRSELQFSSQTNRINEISQEIARSGEPIAGLEKNLAEKLTEKVEAEKNLANARARVQEIDTLLRTDEQNRSEAEQKIQVLRTGLENAKMDLQETKVRLETVQEQMQEEGRKVEDILSGLDETADRNAWQEKLSSIERKISRLGPINMTAIVEFNQLTERKEYLDKQHEDLTEALTTLDNAIRKIDRETRTRFKETFDDLNANLKSMFPVLFGGGHAYLELIGNDLLDTGVTIMAQPPGKRNSTIHLLSGGEKALTAVALVFGIFKLNPAPFCILDEVDAPLDDTNVGRFSELLKQMSSEVQFIFITHNKITMEIAQQLMGVTMYEPGVSRLVSVDVDEAVQLADSA